MSIDLTVIIPVLNEVESLPHLHSAIQVALSAQHMVWEVVYVDDGSTDGSCEILEELARVMEDGFHV